MGDCSVEAYDHLISLFKKCAAEMKPFTEVRDGLGLEDRDLLIMEMSRPRFSLEARSSLQ